MRELVAVAVRSFAEIKYTSSLRSKIIMIKTPESRIASHLESQPQASLLDAMQIDLLQVLLRHYGKIILSVLACWAMGAAYFVFTNPDYESTAEILLEPKNEAAVSGSFDSSTGANRTLSDDSMASHLAMIQSHRIINEGLNRAKLTNLPSLVESMSSKHRSPAEYVQENLTVTRGGSGATKKAHTLRLKFRHGNSEDCKLILDAIVTEFQSFVEEKFADDKERLVKTIDKAQSLNKQELVEANEAYRKFRQEAPLLWSGRESTNIPRMLYEQIETELNTFQIKKTELQSRLSVITSQLADIDAQEAKNPDKKKVSDIQRMALIDEGSAERIGILLQVFAGDATTAEFQSAQPMRMSAAQTEAAGLLELRQKQQRLELEYGSQHPTVEALKVQIADMQKFVKEKYAETSYTKEESLIDPKTLLDAYVRLLQNDLFDIAAKQKELTIQSEKAKNEARELVNYELDGEMLKERVDDLRSLFETTVDKLRGVNLAAGYGGLISETLQASDIGERVWPKLSIILALATLLGLFLGGASATLGEIQNRSLRTAQDIERVADLPILSQIPSLKSISDRKYLSFIKKSGSMLAPTLCTAHDSKSQESEVFRGLRTLLFFRAAEVNAKTFAITSSNSGDGKSTLSGNLAVSIAQSGRKVLLVECDMRQPAVAKLFACDNGLGISDVLNKKITLEKATKRTEVDNLDSLSAGTLPSNPAELLASKEFGKLIEQIEDIYDFVILDCPPVLAVADPCIVAAVADAVLVVVRLNPQSRVELRRTIDMLKDVNALTIGIVVNASELEDEVAGTRKNGYMVGYGYGANGAKANGYYHSKKTPQKQEVK